MVRSRTARIAAGLGAILVLAAACTTTGSSGSSDSTDAARRVAADGPGGTDASTSVRAVNLHDRRYCEILILTPAAATGAETGTETGTETMVADVYATLGVNDCPDDRWVAIDVEAVGEEYEGIAVRNGPRHWLSDSIEATVGPSELTTFGDLEFRRAATLPIDLGAARLPFQERAVTRSTRFTFDAGTEVYELTAPDGRVFVMQSYSLALDPSLTVSDLAGLEDRLTLPPGWSFEARRPAQDLLVTDVDGVATVIQDEFDNTYQLEHSP